MDTYSIENFWKSRLASSSAFRTPASTIEGWGAIEHPPHAFMEAPLTLSKSMAGDSDPSNAPILLISAPGAVGKSTLARKIANVTGAVYLDLATAGPIASDSFTGGLVNSGLYDAWQSGDTAVLVDGLDEARLRVSFESFAAFLNDVAQRSQNRKLPTALFGRTGAVEDAWLILQDHGIETSVLEIGFYGREDSVEFAISRVVSENPQTTHLEVRREAVQLLLDNLREQTSSDGDRFAGYAPVLMAVARRVAEDDNPAAMVANIGRGEESVTLQSIVLGILKREAEKLAKLSLENPDLLTKLYRPEEQLDRIVARLYGGTVNNSPIVMTNHDRQIYDNALKTWVPDHPFIGGGEETRSIVFDAAISAHALRNSAASEMALQKELTRGAGANPFLSELYAGLHPRSHSETDAVNLRPEHIGALYASFRARLSLGDSANLLVDGDKEPTSDETSYMDVEITVNRNGREHRTHVYKSSQTGTVRMGTHVEDVEIDIPQGKVEIGLGDQAILSAPVAVNCMALEINATKVIVDNPSRVKSGFVSVRAEECRSTSLTSLPILRNDVGFGVSWTNSETYPWTDFPLSIESHEDPRIDEGLRRLRKFVVMFRAKGSSQLARFRQKIESPRMTKGSGQAILDALKGQRIISIQENMCVLNANTLGNRVGVTYMDCQNYTFGSKAVEFVRHALRIPTPS